MGNNEQLNEQLIEAAGGVAAVAAEFGISLQAVYKWIKQGIPPKRVIRVCQMAGKKWNPKDYCPEMYQRAA